MTSQEMAMLAAKSLDHKKAQDIRVIGIRDISVLADYFVIASGTSSTHVHALADEVEYQLSEAGEKPMHTEGYASNNWILLDYGSVVVHVFQDKMREFYDLERLWKDGEEMDLSTLTALE